MKYFIEMSLRDYVYHYIPKGWKEHIGNVDFVSYWTEEEAKQMQKDIYPKGTPWYIIEAAKSFFEGVNYGREK